MATNCLLPNHEDRSPSFVIYPETNSWYCFSCLRGGDVVELARLAWGYDKRDAHAAAAKLLMEFDYKVPQRPRSWFAKQERQKPLRGALEQAKVRSAQRRLMRTLEPLVASIENPEEPPRRGAKDMARPRRGHPLGSQGGEPMSRHGIPEDVADRLGITNITDITDDPTELPVPDVFPTGALPRPCQILVEEAAAAIGCPPDFVALPMLVVLGSAIGNSRVLKLKAGWEESAIIYGTVIADPDDKKTPALKVALEVWPKTHLSAVVQGGLN